MISNLVEHLNIYGMSVDKFKRILKMLVIEFMRTSPYIHVHKVIAALEVESLENAPVRASASGLINRSPLSDEEYQAKFEKLLSSLSSVPLPVKSGQGGAPLSSAASKSVVCEEIVRPIEDYIAKRRLWHKAFEVLTEIVRDVQHDMLDTPLLKSIYKNQFILNYLNKPPRERVGFVLEQMKKLRVAQSGDILAVI